MKDRFVPFDEFFHKYEGLERDIIDDIVRRYSATDQDHRQTISSLIDSRQKQRDGRLESLSSKSKKLLKRLQAIEIERMLEEIQCFKDVIALQKRLTENDPTYY